MSVVNVNDNLITPSKCLCTDIIVYIHPNISIYYRIEAIECTQRQQPLNPSEEIKTWNENNSLRYLTHRLITRCLSVCPGTRQRLWESALDARNALKRTTVASQWDFCIKYFMLSSSNIQCPMLGNNDNGNYWSKCSWNTLSKFVLWLSFSLARIQCT